MRVWPWFVSARVMAIGAALAASLVVGCAASGTPARPGTPGSSETAAPAAAAPGQPSSTPDLRLGELMAAPRRSSGCSEAAAGFDNGTRGIRAPERSMLAVIRERCMADAWPAAAIDCFARMTEGDLGRCAGELPMRSRDRMFASLGGGGHDGGNDAISSQLSLAISVAKLEGLRVGVAACDAFITAVRRALACAAMSVETRVSLGAETADFWSLPSSGLPARAQQKMSDVCDRSRAVVEDEILAAGCMP